MSAPNFQWTEKQKARIKPGVERGWICEGYPAGTFSPVLSTVVRAYGEWVFFYQPPSHSLFGGLSSANPPRAVRLEHVDPATLPEAEEEEVADIDAPPSSERH
jgi:hypothetical protein